MKEYLKKALAGPDGDPSAMRLMAFIVVAAFVPTIIAVTIYTAIANPQYIGEMVIAILGTICGVLGVKAYQSKNESVEGPVDATKDH